MFTTIKAAVLNSDNIVENIIVVDSLDVFPNLISAEGGAIGDLWNGTTFVKQVIPPVVPSSVTMRQARLVLRKYNLLAAVQTAIDSLESPDKEDAQIEWDYSSEVFRSKKFVSTLGPLMGLTDEQLDTMFIEAAKL